MPEVRLSLEWPDGRRSELYSPSTVILDFLQPGQTLSVAELTSKGMTGLGAGASPLWLCLHKNRRGTSAPSASS